MIELLREFPSEEPTRKRFIQEIIGWSGRFGPVERGDPELHHASGTVYAEGTAALRQGAWQYLTTNSDQEPYEAEKHLALGTSESAETLAKLEYEWYTNDEPHTAGLYAARAVIPFLLIGNLRSANKAFLIFTSRLISANPNLGVQEVSSASSDARVFPALPLFNFLNLLLLSIQRGAADMFKQLTAHYATQIREAGILDDALAQIGEQYFAINVPRQGNPLLDMMGSMLFGGGQDGARRPTQGRNQPRKVEAPPTNMELD